MKNVGGIIEVKKNGTLLKAKGTFTLNFGRPKREEVIGSDSVHGFKTIPQVAMVEGAITLDDELDIDDILLMQNENVIVTLNDGRVAQFRGATYADEGNFTTEESELGFRVIADSGQLVR